MMEFVEIKTEEPDREEKDPFSQIEYVASAIVSEVNGVPEIGVTNLTTQSWPSRLATVFNMENNHLQPKWVTTSHEHVGSNVSKKRKIEELSDMASPERPPVFMNKMNSISALLGMEPSQPHSESKLLKQLLSAPSGVLSAPSGILSASSGILSASSNVLSAPSPTSPPPGAKSTRTYKPLPPLRRISELESPSIDDKEAIDILTDCGADISDEEDGIVTKSPSFSLKINAVEKMIDSEASVSSDDITMSMETETSPDNRLEPTEEVENENVDEPNGDDILARLNDSDELFIHAQESVNISTNKPNVEKVEIPDEEYDKPLDLVKRKVESVEQLLNPNKKYSTQEHLDISSKKEQLKKNKIKLKPETKVTEISENKEERYRRYDPKIEITKLMALLLRDKDYNPSVIKWVDSDKGIFKITNTNEFAKLRGKQRNSNSYMEFKHVNRNIRYHTHPKCQGKGTGKLHSILNQRLTYQFTDQMEFDWRPRLSEDCIGNPTVLDYHKLGI